MSSIFSSAPDRRKEAREILRHAEKVVRYRGDVIPAANLAELTVAQSELALLVAEKESGKEALKAATAKLETLLRRDGGRVYPLGMAADWTETFVILAILAGGVRAFLFQPFKIPTNSMYPTFHGMTAEVYTDKDAEPNPAVKAWRKLTLGATHYAPVAPADGEVLIPMKRGLLGDVNFEPAGKTLDDGILGTRILKGVADSHRLFVGNREITLVVPAEFNFRDALLKSYFPTEAAMPVTEQERWSAVFDKARERGDIVPTPSGALFLRTHRTVKAGEPVIRFDVLTGDMVIVDRMSYHFVKPSVGDDFVFRTSKVPGFKVKRDDFYIKRLVGLPGDTLRVEDKKLFRNGALAAGNIGFDMNNAHRSDLEYYGYGAWISDRSFDLTTPLDIPAGHYWAMGDNSANSADSREFGFVPEEALVGKAVFILHPFTKRWGVTK